MGNLLALVSVVMDHRGYDDDGFGFEVKMHEGSPDHVMMLLPTKLPGSELCLAGSLRYRTCYGDPDVPWR